EDPVAEAEDHQVAHRLLAQVVIDAVDLALLEDREELAVEGDRRVEVMPEGLLDDDARPAVSVGTFLVEAHSPELLDDGRVEARLGGQVEEPVVQDVPFLVDGVDAPAQALE